MLRTWRDVVAKWRLADPEHDGDAAAEAASRARAHLLAGRLDEALADFTTAATLRADPLDEVGIGDVHLARGRWRAAADRYRRAARTSPDSVMAALGLSQALVAAGHAHEAATELERVYGTSQDPVVRYYLASTWASAADQTRPTTKDDVLVFTDESQIALCRHAATRIHTLTPDDEELTHAANRLTREVRAATRWAWHPEGLAVGLAVLAALFGLLLVAIGGVTGNPALVVVGLLAGAALLYLIVIRFRRQAWRQRAVDLQADLAHHGT